MQKEDRICKLVVESSDDAEVHMPDIQLPVLRKEGKDLRHAGGPFLRVVEVERPGRRTWRSPHAP